MLNKGSYRLLFLSLILTLTFGHAINAKAFSEHDNVFEKLQDLFEQGTLPTNADMVGWRSGRCYFYNDPFTPRNGLFTAWTEKGPDHGPISTNQEILFTLPVFWSNGEPGVFDDPSPEIKRRVSNFVDSQKFRLEETTSYRGSMHGFYRNNPTASWAARKSNDYLVVQMNQNGLTDQMCYYFKKIDPK